MGGMLEERQFKDFNSRVVKQFKMSEYEFVREVSFRLTFSIYV